MLDEKYKEQISVHEFYFKKFYVTFNVLGYMKLVSIILLIINIYSNLKNPENVSILLPIITIAAIVFLWTYHKFIHESLNYSEGMIKINKEYLARITGNWTSFKDTGNEFADKNHPYCSDLDIIGEESLFQFLNTAKTWFGRKRFSNDLLHNNYSKNEILKRQRAISELSKNYEFVNIFQYFSEKTNTSTSMNKFINELKNSVHFISSPILKILLTFLPLATVIFVFYVVIFSAKNLYLIAFSMVVFQAILWVLYFKKSNDYLNITSTASYKFRNYAKLLDLIRLQNFESEKLNELKSKLESNNISAIKAINELGKIYDRTQIKYNWLLNPILNIFLLWDLECSFLLEKWKIKYSPYIDVWFETIGEFESLMSFSNLKNISNNISFPEFSDKNNYISANNMGHPLINVEIRVCNDIEMDNSIFIISGSNMSGKTTFLRTLGINSVLFNAGAPVCAEKIVSCNFEIAASMRISDDLKAGVSTFYAELKKIKTILEISEQNSNTLFLIDEIFRGTNSEDRLYGAKKVLEQLKTFNVIGMITTHDLELCKMENASILNYNFSEHYENDKILFDYKMKKGKATGANAKYLMKMIGI